MKPRLNNRKKRRLPATFGPLVEFDVPTAEARTQLRTAFDRLEGKLLGTLFNERQNVLLQDNLKRAATEAAALAWTTQYPTLLFPVLLEEKARTARTQTEKQYAVHRKSEALLEDALCQ